MNKAHTTMACGTVNADKPIKTARTRSSETTMPRWQWRAPNAAACIQEEQQHIEHKKIGKIENAEKEEEEEEEEGGKKEEEEAEKEDKKQKKMKKGRTTATTTGTANRTAARCSTEVVRAGISTRMRHRWRVE